MQEQPNQIENRFWGSVLVCSFLEKQFMGKESGVLFRKKSFAKIFIRFFFNFKKWCQNEDTTMTLLEMNGRKWISQISSHGFDFHVQEESNDEGPGKDGKVEPESREWRFSSKRESAKYERQRLKL